MPDNNYIIQDVTIPVAELFEIIHSETVPRVLLPQAIEPNDAMIGNPDSELHHPIGLFSSGTTGRPKCIWNSYARLQQNAKISAGEFEVTKNDRLLLMAKPWHVAGFSWVLMSKYAGCKFRFVTTQKGEEDKWIQAINEFKPTCLLTVPAILRSLYRYKDWFIPRIGFGGSAIEPQDYKELKKHAKVLYQGYGQTEAGGLISAHKIDLSADIRTTWYSCYGKPLSMIQIKCEGTADEPAAIIINSPTACFPGFYDSGDMGYFDGEGMLHLVGRKK